MFNTLGGAVHTAGEKDLTVVSSSVRSTRYFVVVESGWKPEAGEVKHTFVFPFVFFNDSVLNAFLEGEE